MIIAALVFACTTQLGTPLPDASIGTTRGITGSISVPVADGVLRSRPDLDLNDPLLVRIAGSRPLPEGGLVFDLEYMGTTAGTFDLRDVLVFADGRPIDTLAPIEVHIASHLGLDAPSDLELSETPPSLLHGGYLFWLTLLAIVWLAVPVVVIARRLLRPKPHIDTPPTPPTLADVLQPLVQAASSGALSIDQQARLELLLHRYWSTQLALDLPPHEAIAQLRNHETAGELLRAVEGWLHNPHAQSLSQHDLAALLAPYADIAADPPT